MNISTLMSGEISKTGFRLLTISWNDLSNIIVSVHEEEKILETPK